MVYYITYLTYNIFNIIDALLTYVGVIFLHASVDIFNDYWDYKRGIDTTTKRTNFSGGTGVLPEKKLQPNIVYKAGFLCMVIGLAIGGYFIFQSGLLIAIILAVATLSIYFYSTTIVNIGLGETLVAVKGTMIVIGTCLFVQSGIVDLPIVFLGIIIGILSSIVLYIASFPDFDADKEKGRKTLVILIGKNKSAQIFPLLIILIYSLITIGIIMQYLPIYSIITFHSLIFAIRASKKLKNYDNIQDLVKAISYTITFSRIVGICLILSYLIAIINK